LLFSLCLLLVSGCTDAEVEKAEPAVPRGYTDTLAIETEDGLIGFGPFVGYYFRPPNPQDLSLLHFVCYNEGQFYTLDLPDGSHIFEGEARFVELRGRGFDLPSRDRVKPVFFDQAPAEWLLTRPEPKEEFVHFHSCYNSAGPVYAGYWIRHLGKARFTYDMGGRVGPGSPLYHEVTPGPDKKFARIMEFDRGLRYAERE
jgi:hypothetical protein